MRNKNFECKAFLKLKIPEKNNMMRLSRERYELVDFDYCFHRGTDRGGEINTGLRGGTVNMSIIGTPSDDLLAWMFDHTKKFNGELTVMDTAEETMEQAYFEEGRLTALEIRYRADNKPKPHTVTQLQIVVETLRVSDTYFENLNR